MNYIKVCDFETIGKLTKLGIKPILISVDRKTKNEEWFISTKPERVKFENVFQTA